MRSPTVSVIIATYNRSAVLRHVLEVLRLQTFEDWEAVVVGDACTDDTAEVVAGLHDPRFRFHNLPRNHGEQSVANNEGLRLARGRMVAFLNHDDFWRQDHLEHALDRLTRDGDDLVYSWVASLLPDETVVLLGVSPGGSYSPAVVVPASAWVMRRELVDRVGPWENGWAIRLPPSQHWIWRASRLGARLTEVPRVSVLALPSGARPGSYDGATDTEHARWRARVTSDPDWAEALLVRYVHAQTTGGRIPAPALPLAQISSLIRNSGTAAIARLGVHPLALLLMLRHRRRGGFLRWLRERRGLPLHQER